MKVSPKKKIVIPFNNFIPVLKRRGPIDVPYMETFQNISNLINSRIPVYEVLSNGMKVKLTLMNFDKQNDTALNTIKANRAPKKKNGTVVVTDEDINANSMASILANSTKRMPDHRELSKSTPTAPTSVNISDINVDGVVVSESGKPHKNYTGNRKDSQVVGSEIVELK